jgi:nickel and cobalt resistance protein CnrR
MKRVSLAIILVAFVAALVGTVIGRSLTGTKREPVTDLHVLLYEDLNLSSTQQTKLKLLERDYLLQKGALDQTLRDENAVLARAIETEHGYGPNVEAAIDRSHHTMGKLQKITLEHIFAMRGTLTPDQAKRYDKVVTQLLVDANR